MSAQTSLSLCRLWPFIKHNWSGKRSCRRELSERKRTPRNDMRGGAKLSRVDVERNALNAGQHVIFKTRVNSVYRFSMWSTIIFKLKTKFPCVISDLPSIINVFVVDQRRDRLVTRTRSDRRIEPRIKWHGGLLSHIILVEIFPIIVFL